MKLDAYAEKEGPAKGLINANYYLDEVVIQCMVEAIRPMLKTGKDLHKVDDLTRKALPQVARSLEGKFYKEIRRTYSKKDGSIISEEPVLASPRAGMVYYRQIKDAVASELTESFVENTPTLQHHPNAKVFLETLSRMFPNVCDAKDTANAFRAFIENVHASCHTPGARDSQSCLWLVSHHVGGTGKSYFMRKCAEVLTEMGVDNAFKILSATRQGFIDLDMGQHTVVFSEDTPKLDGNLAEIINNIIDKSDYGFNEKYGRKGIARSFANLVIGSNYESFEDNTRRYNQVEFIGVNLEKLPPDQQGRLPLWEKHEEYKEAIRTLFDTCPFGVGFKYRDGHTTDIIRVRDQGILGDIHATLEAMDENHFGKSHAMYPTAFVKHMLNLGVVSECSKKETTTNLLKFLAQCQNDGKLKEQGRTPIRQRLIDFNQFRTMSNGYQDTDADWIAETKKQWESLVWDWHLPTDPDDFDSKKSDETPKEETKQADGIPQPNAFFDNQRSKPIWAGSTTRDDYQFETLNPIDPEKARESVESGESKTGCTDRTVSSMRNFVFECDDAPLEWQKDLAMQKKGTLINRAVYSGGKSIHCRVTIDFEPKDLGEYKRIWDMLNEEQFEGEADKACANPSRKTRHPNGFRFDKETTQEVLYNIPGCVFPLSNYEQYMRRIREVEELDDLQGYAPAERAGGRHGDGSRLETPKVREFLVTHFAPGVKHGGAAHSGFYKAVLSCKSGDDATTLEMVLTKARTEGWREPEIRSTIRDAEEWLASHAD